jgi:hypothetical protein
MIVLCCAGAVWKVRHLLPHRVHPSPLHWPPQGQTQRTNHQVATSGSESGIPSLFDPWFWHPGSGMGKKSGSGSGIRDEQPGSYFLELRNHFFGVKILKFFDGDPRSGMETIRIRDPGWNKVGSGINITDPQHW